MSEHLCLCPSFSLDQTASPPNHKKRQTQMGERPSCVEHLLCVCGRGLLSVAQWPGGPLNITSCHLGSQTQGGGSNVSSSWLLGRQGTITIHTEYVRLKKTPCESEWQLVCFGGPPHPRGRASKVS